MYTTVTCHSLAVVKLGTASSALLTWVGPVHAFEQRELGSALPQPVPRRGTGLSNT